jgi:hypothetical protein
MKQRWLMGLLALGALVGYGAGFASLRHGGACHWEGREERLARMCADAAHRAAEPSAPSP